MLPCFYDDGGFSGQYGFGIGTTDGGGASSSAASLARVLPGAASGGGTIIGNTVMRGYIVHFDRGGRRVGFARGARCGPFHEPPIEVRRDGRSTAEAARARGRRARGAVTTPFPLVRARARGTTNGR